MQLSNQCYPYYENRFVIPVWIPVKSLYSLVRLRSSKHTSTVDSERSNEKELNQ